MLCYWWDITRPHYWESRIRGWCRGTQELYGTVWAGWLLARLIDINCESKHRPHDALSIPAAILSPPLAICIRPSSRSYPPAKRKWTGVRPMSGLFILYINRCATSNITDHSFLRKCRSCTKSFRYSLTTGVLKLCLHPNLLQKVLYQLTSKATSLYVRFGIPKQFLTLYDCNGNIECKETIQSRIRVQSHKYLVCKRYIFWTIFQATLA